MATIDRRGVSVSAVDTPIAGDPNPGLGIKAPCLVATTGNIVLSGLQTVDGVVLAAGNRVVVWQQTDTTQNGLYNASSGPWTRTIDANSNDKLASGLLVAVSAGATNAHALFELVSVDPIVLGSSAITFVIPASVPATRRIDTSAPLAGGGDLSANRTLSVSPNGISYALMQQAAAQRLLGNPTGAGANVSEISLGAALAFSGAALQTVAMTGDVTTSANSFATTIAANAVTYAKLQQIAASSLLGNPTGLLANGQGITLGATLAFSGTALQTAAMTGDVTTSANSFATSIAANAVTYAKFQQVAASSLVGNPTGSLANAQGVTLGATLAFSGTALQTVAHTGDVTTSANSFATTIAAGAVSLAKMANLAANSVIGNNTGAPATPVALTASQVLDLVGSTRGNVLYRGATGWAVLAPGGTNTVLTGAAAGADPSWQTNVTLTSLSLTATTDSAAYNAGALVVAGGIGVAGRMYVGDGSTSGAGSINLNGGAGANQGAVLLFRRNATALFGFGNSAALLGGTSNDFVIYGYTTGAGTIAALSISDANGGVFIGSHFGTTSPVTKTTSYSVGITDNSIIHNGAGSITATLPSAATYPGRVLWMLTIAAQTVVSASSNVIPITGGAAGTAILTATAGKWARLQSTGSAWQITAAN